MKWPNDVNMNTLLLILKAIAVLIGASMLGNWFLADLRSAKKKGLPWYTAYMSPPGILIIIIVLIFPILLWFLHR